MCLKDCLEPSHSRSSVSTGQQASVTEAIVTPQSQYNIAGLSQKVYTEWRGSAHWPFGFYVLQLPERQTARKPMNNHYLTQML